MKKIILMIVVTVALSCSKSEDESQKTLPLSYANLAGKWNFTTIVKPDGSTVPFVGLCPTKTDWVEFFTYNEMKTYNYYADGNSWSDNGTTGYYFEGNKFKNAGLFFDEATATTFTSNTLRIDYPSGDYSLGFATTYTHVKAIIFTRQ